MGSPTFSFKKFTVRHSLCAMKVGTDGVLLGAWAPVDGVRRILDIGTGSGLIALMLAQRSVARLTALDIDENAALQASINFAASPWMERFTTLHTSLQKFESSEFIGKQKFDLIVSNPPFFMKSLKSGNNQRDLARHTDTLPLESLFKSVARLLTSTGRFAIVFPYESQGDLEDMAWEENLHPYKIVTVRNSPTAAPKRVLMLFGFEKRSIEREDLILRDINNHYSEAFRTLTSDFYLHFV